MSTMVDHSVKATLNFAGNLKDGGRHDNCDDSRNVLDLAPRECQIADARALPNPVSLDREGFTLVQHEAGEARWKDDEWIDNVYAPSCEDLVKKLTGAKRTLQFHRPLLRFSDPADRGGHMHTAGFVHIDNPRETGMALARHFAEEQGVSFQRAKIFNVWKTFSPAPQDRPLAVADRRTTPPATHVVGLTIDGGGETPYIIVAPHDGVDFYYFPDMTADESIVFTGVDFDPDNPVGCAHSAFVHPDGGVARASIEARVIAIFE